MQYPALMRKINKTVARCSGAVFFIVSALAVFEAIARHFFSSPTSWTINISCFAFLWAIFLGSAYAFQEHGHVSVDMLRDLIEKRTKSGPSARRAMSVAGYCISFVIVMVFFYGGWQLCVKAITLDQLAPTIFYFRLIWVYPAIVAGSALMLVTLVFIILDLFSGGKEYM